MSAAESPMRVERVGANDARFDAFISYSHSADGLLAPRLAAGLQRFAKPWYRPRAMRVFRDEASLSANPHLWASITNALDKSEWFVLLLSPDAAQSEWVNKEIDYWLDNKNSQRILPVVTEGEIDWTAENGGLPPALAGIYTEEPRWVDLRFARTDHQLDLKNPRFSAAVADIASAVRGVAKDQLESEEVRQHRRTVRTAWTGAALVTLLAVAAVGFAINASQERDRANQLTQAEAQARADAEQQTAVAQQALQAESDALQQQTAARTDAEDAARLADARALVASAVNVLDADPELSVLLTLAAADQARGDDVLFPEARVALRQAMAANRLETSYVNGQSDRLFIDLAPDSETLVAADESGLVLFHADTGDVTATLATGQSYWFPAFSPDGRWVVASQFDDDPAVDVFEVATGRSIVTLTSDDEYTVAAPGFSFSPDGAYIQVLTGDRSSGSILFYDTATWTVSAKLEGLDTQAYGSFDGDGDRILVAGRPGRLFSFPDLTVLSEVPPVSYGALRPDGTVAFIADQGRTQELRPTLYDVEAGQTIDRADGVNAFLVAPIRVSPDGRVVYFSTRGSDVLSDAATGLELMRFPAIVTNSAAFSRDGLRLVTSHPGGLIRVWDLSDRQQAGVRLNPAHYTPRLVNSDRLVEGDPLSIWMLDDADPTNRWLTVLGRDGSAGASIRIEQSAPLPDGRFLVIPWTDDSVGPLSIWDPGVETLTPVDECSVPVDEFDIGNPPVECGGAPFLTVLSASVDGTEVFAAVNDDGDAQSVTVFDAATLERRRQFETAAPAGEILLATHEWLLVARGGLTVVDATTGEVIHQMDDRPWRGSAQLSTDGGVLYLGDLFGSVVAFDTATWEIADEWQAHAGSNRGLALSPDGSQLATTGDDGLVRLWSTTDHAPLDQIPVPFPADAMFIDETTLGVVSSTDPTWFVINLDPAQLLNDARASVTRTLTPTECRIYEVRECPDG